MSNSIREMNGALASVPIETAGTAGSGTSAQGGKPTADAAAPVGDAANLSPLGDLLGAATHAAASLKSFQPELVAAIKSKIAAGTYQADPNAVASRVAGALRGIK